LAPGNASCGGTCEKPEPNQVSIALATQLLVSLVQRKTGQMSMSCVVLPRIVAAFIPGICARPRKSVLASTHKYVCPSVCLTCVGEGLILPPNRPRRLRFAEFVRNLTC
jgi:hypothetical protein